MSARWSSEQEATLLSRMGEGATVEQVAGELGKSVANIQMKWSIVRPVEVEEAKEADKHVVVVDYSAELQAVKDAVAALEAKLITYRRDLS